MQATATGISDTGYLKKLRRYNHLAAIFSGLVTLTSLSWMLFRFGGSTATEAVIAISYLLTACMGAFWAIQTAYHAKRENILREPRYYRAWFLMGLGLLMSTLSTIGYLYLYLIGQLTPFSFATIVNALYYPLMLAGIVALPNTRSFRVSAIFDALIATLCILGLSWFFIIGPLSQENAGFARSFAHILDFVTTFVYPFGDIFLLTAFIPLVRRDVTPPMCQTFCLLALGFLSTTWADVASSYIIATTHTYHFGVPYIDIFWLIGCFLPGLAIRYQYGNLVSYAHRKRTQAQPSQPVQPDFSYQRQRTRGSWRVQSLLIYLPLACVLGLVAFAEAVHDSMISDALSILGAFIASLLALRHFFATRENEALLREREQRHQESEHLRSTVTPLTNMVELEQLRDQIATTMITEFGCSATLLLLVDEYGSLAPQQPHLLANTAASATGPTRWRLYGNGLLHQIVFSGKQTTLQWLRHASDIPIEVRLWLQKQDVEFITFYPLIYQDQILGSLGIARDEPVVRQKKTHPNPLIPMYVAQITPIIERAYLYQEIHEREAFARAMVNIATRLNAAAVGSTEISQLICEEGSKALRADYVLLYQSAEKRLLPQAMACSQAEPALSLQDWPALSVVEREFPSEMYPTLLDITRRQTVPLSESVEEEPSRAINSFFVLPAQQMLTLRAKLARHSIHTAILAPLLAGGHLIGLLIFMRAIPPESSDRRAFNASDLPHAQDFVEQARVAFANAQLYQHVHTAHERLKELDQLKDQFMVTASHELRTPLTAVQGYIELIAQFDEVLPAEQRQEFLIKAQRGCEELAVLLENVMDASRLEVDAGIIEELIKRVAIREIVEKVIVMIEPQLAQEKRQVHVDIPHHLHAYADPMRLRQVFMNISVNALKYSPSATPVSYTACTVTTEEGEQVIISISDKGRGIAPQEQAHLFQKFYRLERDINSPIRGSGLGLYISHRLIENMGGTIWIESKGIPGEGSTFHIQLPLAR